MTTPNAMRAVVIPRFGGIETLELQSVPVPAPGENEVLVRLEYAGVGEWDPFEREGGYAEMQGTEPRFPYVLGSEGAGTVAAVGAAVRRFRTGDRVFAVGFLNPRGGFYAEYAAVDADLVACLPSSLTAEQGGVVGGVGLTALRGLSDVLEVGEGTSVAVFGASGGVGHLAVQLARRMGARVLAIASGPDGVALAERVGADAVVDGRGEEIDAAARAFAPGGLDAALLTAGGQGAKQTLAAVRPGGRAAYPNGIRPEHVAPSEVEAHGYNGEPDREILERLHRFLDDGSLEVHVSRTFPLEQAAEAHRALEGHYLGKLVLRTG